MTPAPSPNFLTDLTAFKALDQMIDFFRESSVIGYLNLLPYSITLLLVFVGLDIVFSWSIYNGSMRMQELISKLIKVGILLFIIQHMPEINSIIIRSFQQWGFIAAGTAIEIDKITTPANIMGYSLTVLTDVWTAMEKISIFTAGGLSTLFGCIMATIAVLFSFFLMAMEVMMVIIEFNIFASLLVILIPFAAMKQTSFLFQRCVSTVINYGVKMMIIYFLIGLITTTSVTYSKISTANLSGMLVQSMVYLALGYIVYKVPTIISGMLNGQPSMSGNGVASSVASASAPGKALSSTGAAIGGVAAVAAASRVQGVNKWDTFRSSSAQFGKNMLGMAKAKAGASVLRGADKTNELLRAGNAIENGTWKRQTDEQRNTGMGMGMTNTQNVPLSQKAQERYNDVETSVNTRLDNLKDKQYEMPTSTPYSSSTSTYSSTPTNPPKPTTNETDKPKSN